MSRNLFQLTSAEFLNDIRRTQATKVSATEASKQANARSESFGSWCNEMRKFWRFAIQDNSYKRSSCLSELMDNVYAI